MANERVAAELLKQLGVEASNPGACNGTWIDTTGPELVSVNPTTGEQLAVVRQAGLADYERVISDATSAFETWRMMPAPARGEIVRQLGRNSAPTANRSAASSRWRWARSSPRGSARCRR